MEICVRLKRSDFTFICKLQSLVHQSSQKIVFSQSPANHHLSPLVVVSPAKGFDGCRVKVQKIKEKHIL